MGRRCIPIGVWPHTDRKMRCHRRAFQGVLPEGIPETGSSVFDAEPFRIAHFLEDGGGDRKTEARIGIAFRPALQAMIDFDGQNGKPLLFSLHGLERRSGNEFLEHQACRIDDEVAPIGIGQILGIVEGHAPAGKGFCKGCVVDLSRETRILKQINIA